MRAVAEGYLDYKDCDLEEKELQTLERWSISHIRSRDVAEIKNINLKTLSSCLPVSADPSKQIDSIQELVHDLIGAIIGTSEEYIAKGDEQRYKDVFGEIDDDEVDKLNEHLENRIIQIDQEQMEKEQALKVLERELQRKFKRRI